VGTYVRRKARVPPSGGSGKRMFPRGSSGSPTPRTCCCRQLPVEGSVHGIIGDRGGLTQGVLRQAGRPRSQPGRPGRSSTSEAARGGPRSRPRPGCRSGGQRAARTSSRLPARSCSRAAARLVDQKDGPDAPHEAMLRFRVAVAREAGELGSFSAAGVVGDRELGAIGEPDATRVQPAREPLLHDRDQLDKRPQAPVVLRLLRQMRKPARQHSADKTEELPVG
jgi:hypothetical protein